MTLLIVSISGHPLEAVQRDVEAAVRLGAEALELRLDLMEGLSDEDVRAICAAAPRGVPLILTIRSREEGGEWDGDEDERISRLIELGPLVDSIDVELATWQRSANIRGKIHLALRRAGHVSQADGREEIAAATPRKLILSRHDFGSRPRTLNADWLAMLDTEACHVPKLAWRARSIRDNFEAFELMRTSPRPAIVVCMGAEGLLSRVLAKKFGAFATFAALAPGRETAAGQLSAGDLKRLYRWDVIDADSDVYGVVGDPVGHSLGPWVHNAAFAATGRNAVYLPMPVAGEYEPFKAFMVEVLANPWLGIRGLSVTLPHKEHALRFIREQGGEVDALAERIGAVNTVTLGCDGAVKGFNTDCQAALDAVCTARPSAATKLWHRRPACGSTGETPVPQVSSQGAKILNVSSTGSGVARDALGGVRAAVLGAGGVARAVVAGLTGAGAEVTVYNRTGARAESLAQAFGCRHAPWDERINTAADWVVNCTRVGLLPEVDATPMPAEALRPGMVVFDTVYRPVRTRLLREAADRGATTIDGLEMFILQARAQFERWSGTAPALAVFRQAAEIGLAATCA